jgi:hypothetical protein
LIVFKFDERSFWSLVTKPRFTGGTATDGPAPFCNDNLVTKVNGVGTCCDKNLKVPTVRNYSKSLLNIRMILKLNAEHWLLTFVHIYGPKTLTQAQINQKCGNKPNGVATSQTNQRPKRKN